MEAKRKLEQNARDHDVFFRQLRGSKDGFSVIADYFSKVTVIEQDKPFLLRMADEAGPDVLLLLVQHL
jgi:hypothetical protein